jgi:hypothetical protein
LSRLSLLLKKRQALVNSLSFYPIALAGNLSRSQVPPKTGDYYWRLTWKEDLKTKIQYVKKDNVDEIREGVNQFSKLKEILNCLGEVNRHIALLQQQDRTRTSAS